MLYAVESKEIDDEKNNSGTSRGSLLIIVAGCAASPTQMYRPAGYSGAAWQIDGDFTDLTKALKIRINGQQVINGRLSLLQGNGELSGRYRQSG